MSVEPIAVVGRGCVLPDALTPDALWRNVREGRSSLGAVPAGSLQVPPERGPVEGVGGSVRGFAAVFDPDGFRVPAAQVAKLGPVFQWVVHAAREALRECGGQEARLPRSGLVLGNLSYPTVQAVRWAASVWLSQSDAAGAQPVEPEERFFSGLPAHFAAEALGLGLGGFALDAACASSLYAFELACDRLRSGAADLMLAGGVSAADPLFLRYGFRELSALSPTGRSRPFHRGADGLVPSEGAGVVALMRLADARASGAPVLAVVRGVGLSNDGAVGGLLGPSQHGQERAMRLAYGTAGIDPATVSLVECHATGTAVGDATEVRSCAEVFRDHRDLPIGSVKSNLGHPLAAAGMAALLKVVGALRSGVRPPTLHADEPVAALGRTPLRPLAEAEPWTGPRRAAVNAFGFGGANAHLIIDVGDDREDGGSTCAPTTSVAFVDDAPPATGDVAHDEIALVALAVRTGPGLGTSAFTAYLLRGERVDDPLEAAAIDPGVLRFPPGDLVQTLPQQVLVLSAAVEAARDIALPRERTAVVIGMGGDLEAARHGVGWRFDVDPDGVPPLTAASVTGTMPNLVAHRICVRLDLGGPGLTVSAEEASGLVALDVGVRALRAGECDAAVVGAVDLSHEPAHRAAALALGSADHPGDTAVVMILKRLSDARRDGQQVLAVLAPNDGDDTAPPGLCLGDAHRPGVPHVDPTTLFGRPHAAVGLLAVAAAVTALRHRVVPVPDGPANPVAALVDAEVAVRVLGAAPYRVRLKAGEVEPWSSLAAPRLAVFSGRDRAEVVANARAGVEADTGPARLVLVVNGSGPDDAEAHAGCGWLEGRATRPPGAAYRDRPVAGEVAFVYPNGSASYRGMGRELALALPDLVDAVHDRYGLPVEHVRLGEKADAVDRIVSATWLAASHTELTTRVLGLRPSASLGYSSGESTALVALRAWPDAAGLMRRTRTDPLFTREVAGEHAAARRYWSRQGITGRQWATYLVHAPVERVRAAVAGEAAVHLMTVNAPDVSVVGGEAGACRNWLVSFGAASVIPVDHDMAAHVPEVAELSQRWWDFHHVPTDPVPGVRFYRSADGNAYTPTADLAADAITDMGMRTSDFAAAVESAHADGVRIFIEHGPRDLCTGWIGRTLGDRDHVAVSLDAPDGGALHRLLRSVADLVAAGVQVDHRALCDLLAKAAPVTVRPVKAVVPPRPAHPPAVTGNGAGGAAMPPAPALPEVPRWSPVRAVASLPDAPLFDRDQLEHLATGRIADLFGPVFTAQDGHRRQTRLPAPPLLVVDRVLDIDAPRGELGAGVIRTETDVPADSWYLDPAGRMPAGLLVEAGQADLLLISWMGVDLLVGDERVYRLLGCEVTFHGPLPAPGETLRYEIHIDGHAEHRGARLFFFRYECRVGGELRLSMRNGQAGFFTDAELAASTGVLWSPEDHTPEPAVVDPPVIGDTPGSYGPAAVRAFAAGDPVACFGPAWLPTRAHVRTPRVSADRLLLLHAVEEFDSGGGPWGRGYLRARTPVEEDAWFFEGHFRGDPCMPGTLMLEGCLQAMAFYLAALGHTVERDGWRFEPESGQPVTMRCRGQVTPRSRTLTYEVFVVSVIASPVPVLVADVLCSVDGVPAFHASRLRLRLVPDWPLDHWRLLGPGRAQRTGEPIAPAELGGLLGYRETQPVAVVDGVPVDRRALLASAWGRPADAFGARFAVFDGPRRLPRLPGPPYQFMSRVAFVDHPPAGAGPGSRVRAEYDVPTEAWYFEQNTRSVMPFAVLMEVALQPCGWFASHLGAHLDSTGDLLFRNLDGEAVVLDEVGPRASVLSTEVELRSSSEYGGMILQSFSVRCCADGVPVMTVETTFGFFPPSAFADQVGLPPPAGETDDPAHPGGPVVPVPTRRPPGLPPPAGPMLRMLDRVTGYWPTGGPKGLGRLRAEKDVDAGAWYFRAHFFQDPVQPGSLGVEAACQLLQHYLVVSGRARGTRFEPVMSGAPVRWKYRGQVRPTDRLVTVELDVVEVGTDERGCHAIGEAWLWVDGKRIYHVGRIGVRAVPESAAVEVLDAAIDLWTADHRPTWTAPVLPFMSVVDALARAAALRTGGAVRALRDVGLSRLLVLDGPLRVRTEAYPTENGCRVLLSTAPGGDGESTYVPAARGLVEVGEPEGEPPPRFPPLPDARPEPDPYATGVVFHGRSLHYLVEHRVGSTGASGTLDAGAGGAPRGLLHQGLLDGALHAVPHRSLWRWSSDIPRGLSSIPHRLDELRLFEPLPDAGAVEVEARFAGFAAGDRRFPRIAVQLVVADRVAVSFTLVLVLVSLGRLGEQPPPVLRAFLRDRLHQPGVRLCAQDEGVTTLRADEALSLDWFPGLVADVYGLPRTAHVRDHLREIAVKDHVGALSSTHPSAVVVDADLRTAHPADRPGERHRVDVVVDGDTVAVRSVDPLPAGMGTCPPAQEVPPTVVTRSRGRSG